MPPTLMFSWRVTSDLRVALFCCCLGYPSGRSYRRFSGIIFLGQVRGRSYHNFCCHVFSETGASYRQFSGRRFLGSGAGAQLPPIFLQFFCGTGAGAATATFLAGVF
jgi:hypothetical protein